MQARLFNGSSNDAEALDRLLDGNRGHNVQLTKDRIVVMDSAGAPVGLLAWRSGGIVHELITGHGLAQRSIANSLVEFAIKDAIRRPYCLHTALFVTDSDRMSTYALALGAVEQPAKRVFQLELRA